MKIAPAKRIRNMIIGLEEIETEYRAKLKAGGEARFQTDNYTTLYIEELRKGKQALERLWKNNVG